MKDVFRQREVDSFFQLGRDFGASLREAFPDCAETQDWVLWMNNVIGDDPARRDEALASWCEGLSRPLAKGSAKYMKAVQSITGAPALVYHAVAYRDADAVHANGDLLRPLDFPTKLRQPCMDEQNRQIFWQYLNEMTGHAYRATRTTPPAVPTVAEIEANIERRRAQKAGGGPAGAPDAPSESLRGGLVPKPFAIL